MLAALKNILTKEEMDSLSKSLVITTDDGYELFGEYRIEANKQMFEVTCYTTYLNKRFYNLKNAVVWTTLDKRNRVKDSQRVAELDVLIEGAAASVSLHKTLVEKSKNLDSKTIYIAKLQDAKAKQTLLQEELSSFIRETKRWQERKFKLAAK